VLFGAAAFLHKAVDAYGHFSHLARFDRPTRSRQTKLFVGHWRPSRAWCVEWKRQKSRTPEETHMNWLAPIVEEICVGMEVTSYDSADISVEL
jgi:coenzyme PQQ precursor peptide PqqA